MFDVWKNVLADIEQSVPHTIYITFFTPTKLISIENQVVKIGTPNVFVVRQLRGKYNKNVIAALQKNGVDFKEVEYIVESSTKIKKKSSGREVLEKDVKTASSVVKSLPSKLPEKHAKILGTGLNPNYTLDSFVVGSNNDLAVSIAKNVIKNPGSKYNPFFLYGGPGLGKTHLVQAIGNEIIKLHPEIKVLYTPTNHFFSEFIELIKKNRGDEFAQKYRKLDVLIIDDFQQIINKDRSQEEFFNIFNDLHQANKQIIVTSDRLPEQIEKLDVRLSSRLTWGSGAIDLQMPTFEDKCAILRSMAEIGGYEIEDEAIAYLAENVKTNIRDLEGQLHRLIAIAELRNKTPLEIINDSSIGEVVVLSRAKGGAIQPRKIVEKVAKAYGLTVEEMTSKSRVSHIKNARQVAMYLLQEEANLSTNKIASEVGVKDHSTVMHGIRKIKKDLKLDFGLREQISSIRGSLYD
ncbi:chromosomal replication initiator protein DnaA [Candidatus Saccharibacteria bacterium]|nr:chromosomal replication initiator protein DnaA [Candidatus Saccharibacteria bacterium]